MRTLAALLIAGVALAACSDDNAEIRADADDVFRYTHWTHHGTKHDDEAELHFTNQTTGESMTWKGGVRDAMVYLEQIDKGHCYRRPVDRDKAEEVPCG